MVYQWFGFVFYCLNPLSVFIMVPLFKETIKSSPHRRILIAGLIHVIVLSVLKPGINEAYLHTGYRYQIPSLILLLCVAGDRMTCLTSKLKMFGFFFYFLTFFVSVTQFYGITQVKFPNLNYKGKYSVYSLPSFIQYPWHVSGGLNSPRVSTFDDYQIAASVHHQIRHMMHANDYIFYLGPTSNWPFALDRMLVESGTDTLFYYDLRNPVYSQTMEQSLHSIKTDYPFLRSFDPIHILMRESRFVIVDASSDIPYPFSDETEIVSKLGQLWLTIKDRFKLVRTFEGKDGQCLELYENHLPLLPYISPPKFNTLSDDLVLFLPDSDSHSESLYALHKSLASENVTVSIKGVDELLSTEITDKTCILIAMDLSYEARELWLISKWVQQSRNMYFFILKDLNEHNSVMSYVNVFNDQPLQHVSFLKQSMGIKPYFTETPPEIPLRVYPLDEITEVKAFDPGPISFGIEFETGFKGASREHLHGNSFPNRLPCATFQKIIASAMEPEIPSVVHLGLYDFFNPLTKHSHSIVFDTYHRYLASHPQHSTVLKHFFKIWKRMEVKKTDRYMFEVDTFFEESKTPVTIKSHYPEFMPLNDWNVYVNGAPVPLDRLEYSGVEKMKIPYDSFSKRMNTLTLIYKHNKLFSFETLLINKTIHPDLPAISIPYVGVNYYPADTYEYYMQLPDYKKFHDDLYALHKAGFNYMRVRYIHPSWYRDYGWLSQNAFKETDPLEVLTFILELGNRYNIRICLDIFSLVGSDMGTSSTWRHDPERFTDYHLIKNQNEFLTDFLRKTRQYTYDIDLINEPEIMNLETFQNWVSQKTMIINELSPHLNVLVGTLLPVNLKNIQYYSIHTYRWPDHLATAENKTFIQEFYLYPPNDFKVVSESKIWDKLSSNLKKWKKSDFPAFVLWGFARPATLYSSANYQEYWESELGIFQRHDGSFTYSYFKLLDQENS